MPRKLIHALEDAAGADTNSEAAERKTDRFRSPCSSVCDWSPVRNYDQNEFIYDQSDDDDDDNSEENGKPGNVLDDLAVTESEETNLVQKEVSAAVMVQSRTMAPLRVICSLFLLFVSIMILFVCLDNRCEDVHLVPT